MPCYFPMQARYELRFDGKKDISFCTERVHPDCRGPDFLLLPCGQCIGCRLEKSREWGLRCVHESKMFENNCFVTLTINPDFLPVLCPTGSLDRDHLSIFVRSLRDKFRNVCSGIRYFGCGEYGPSLGRPHYHLCLFNFDFSDKKLWKRLDKVNYFVSETLQSLWPYGFSVIGDLTFESAAYVARYCMKKITGKTSSDHYGDRRPEFAAMSLRPGIGFSWFEKYAQTDLIPHDNCVLNGIKCPVPRYYDKLWEREFPDSFSLAKEERLARAKELSADNTEARLDVKLKCQEARMKKLYRCLEV